MLIFSQVKFPLTKLFLKKQRVQSRGVARRPDFWNWGSDNWGEGGLTGSQNGSSRGWSWSWVSDRGASILLQFPLWLRPCTADLESLKLVNKTDVWLMSLFLVLLIKTLFCTFWSRTQNPLNLRQIFVSVWTHFNFDAILEISEVWSVHLILQ